MSHFTVRKLNDCQSLSQEHEGHEVTRRADYTKIHASLNPTLACLVQENPDIDLSRSIWAHPAQLNERLRKT